MKTTFLLFLALCCPSIIIAQTTTQSTNSSAPQKPNFFTIVREHEEEMSRELKDDKEEGEEIEDESKQFDRWKWFWESRVDEKGNFPNPAILMQEWEKSTAFNTKIKGERLQGVTALAQWKQIGPAIVPDSTPQGGKGGMGRINCIRLSDKSPSTVWVGTAAGGAWKSTDEGKTWNPMTDNLPALSVSDIAIHPTSASTVFIATGDADVGGSIPYWHYSAGILRTDDGGKTWKPTGLSYFQHQEYIIRRLLISPSTPNLMLAGTNDGILLSSDGGVIWENVQSGNFRDMEYQPGNPLVVYATTGNTVFKSTNAGKNWVQLSSGITGVINLKIAVTPANPNYVYAIGCGSNQGFAGLWLSADAGATWKKQSSSPNILSWSVTGTGQQSQGGQGSYDLAIAAPNAAAATVIIGGVNIWRSINSGTSWDCVAHWSGGTNGSKPYVHADVHELITTAKGYIYAGTDGGIFRSEDGGNSWVDLSKGLCIAQFYRISVGATSANIILGGAQDNGTSRYNGTSWTQAYGGDGMNCIVDYKNTKIVYASIYAGNIYRSTDGGNNWDYFIHSGITGEQGGWVTPYLLHPTTPTTAFAGFVNVWRTTDAGGSWSRLSNFSQGPLTVLEIAESDPKYIYAGNGGGFRYTTDGGTSWKALTLPVSATSIRTLAIDAKKPDRIWIGISGYGTQKVLETSDFGANWKDISSGLPAVPINCVVYQKNSPDRMYAGTDIGVYYRDTLINTWLAYNDGLPATIVSDLKIHYASGKLYAGTFGRGIWSGNLANCNTKIDLAITVKGAVTFCEGDSVTLTAQSGFNSYLWSNGATTPTIVVKTSGTYSASALNATGCPAISTEFVVTVTPRTTPNIVPSRTKPVLCGPADSIQLTATLGFGTYLWNNGDTTRRIMVRQPGKYVVKVTKPGNCDAISDTVELTLATPAPVTISRNGNELTANPAGVSYEWYLNGVKITNATGRTYTPTETSGKISVIVTDDNGCRTISEELVLAADDIIAEMGELFITPNPTSGDISLSVMLPAAGLAQIDLVTTDGKIVRTTSVRTTDAHLETTMNMSDLAAGVYYLRVTAGGREWKRSIVKQ